MNRTEKLNKLHNILVKVRMTVLPSEQALECLYMTSIGTKEEWIGLDEWPAFISEVSAVPEYILVLEGERLVFEDYQSFETAFSQRWIGEVTPWEDYCDEALEEWIDLVDECDGIPLKEL